MSEDRTLTVVSQDAPLTLTWNDDDLRALKETVAKDCNASQFKVFIAACQRLGLDPFARQITPIVQGARMTPQVTIDGFRLIAERTGKYAGQLGPFWCGADGQWQDVWLADTPPVASKVGVIRRGFKEPLWGVARTKAYIQTGSPTWSKMPDVMIAKVAESLALRKAFPNELGGAYTREEMEQAQEEQHEETRVVDAHVVRPEPPDNGGRHQQPVHGRASAVTSQRPAVAPVDPTGGPMNEQSESRQPSAQETIRQMPASPAQMQAIVKLCNALGQPVPEEKLSMEAAKSLIGRLGLEYQKARRA